MGLRLPKALTAQCLAVGLCSFSYRLEEEASLMVTEQGNAYEYSSMSLGVILLLYLSPFGTLVVFDFSLGSWAS